MKTDLSTKTILVCCNPLFADMASRLARDFGKVYLHIPHAGSFPVINQGRVGYGLEGVELVDGVFGEHFDKVDLFCFPDLGHAALAVHLETIGKRVWAARYGEEIEIYRELCKEMMEKAGLPVQPWKLLKGMAALREHLKKTPEQHVKIDRWRGVTESFFSPKYDVVAPKLDEIAHTLGAFQEVLEFIVEDDLPDRVEVGLDTYCIDGEYPSATLVGIEVKDLGYCGEFVKYKAIPEPVTRWTDAMAPHFEKTGYRGFLSNEIRIGKDKVPYMIDATCRAPCPPNELYQEFYTNLAEIIWEGAGGRIVDPVPAGKFGVEVVLKSPWAESNWLPVVFPEKFRANIKLFNAVRVDGKHYVVPQDEQMSEFGAVVGYGETLDDAIEMAREVGESIEAYGLKFGLGSIDAAKEQIEKIEEIGVSPFSKIEGGEE